VGVREGDGGVVVVVKSEMGSGSEGRGDGRGVRDGVR
jgi:hypothetical protein